MIDVMNASTGRSFNTEHVVKDHVLTGTYGTGFALGLLAKDVGIAAALAAAAEVDAPLADLVSEPLGGGRGGARRAPRTTPRRTRLVGRRRLDRARRSPGEQAHASRRRPRR